MDWDPKAFPKLDFNEDYYSVLEVNTAVDAKELKKAYYKLVFKYHPDNIENADMKETRNKQMMVINGAYKILKVVNLRALYDKQRRKGLTGNKTGVKENSVSVPESAPPKPQQPPPRSAGQETVREKKYSGGSGFGGSWRTITDDDDDSEIGFEEEYAEQERERNRQRQREQEPEPQRQTQRERDQQVRDRDREFDFTYDQNGVYQTPPQRQPWGFQTEPVRPDSSFNRDGDYKEVEEYLRRTSSNSAASNMFDGNARSLKVHFSILMYQK